MDELEALFDPRLNPAMEAEQAQETKALAEEDPTKRKVALR